jgi:hypothetical protein
MLDVILRNGRLLLPVRTYPYSIVANYYTNHSDIYIFVESYIEIGENVVYRRNSLPSFLIIVTCIKSMCDLTNEQDGKPQCKTSSTFIVCF